MGRQSHEMCSWRVLVHWRAGQLLRGTRLTETDLMNLSDRKFRKSSKSKSKRKKKKKHLKRIKPMYRWPSGRQLCRIKPRSPYRHQGDHKPPMCTGVLHAALGRVLQTDQRIWTLSWIQHQWWCVLKYLDRQWSECQTLEVIQALTGHSPV